VSNQATLFQLLWTRPVVMRGIKTALVVGPLLIAINHGGAILHGDVDGVRLARMALTVLVPYMVSTVSAAGALARLSLG